MSRRIASGSRARTYFGAAKKAALPAAVAGSAKCELLGLRPRNSQLATLVGRNTAPVVFRALRAALLVALLSTCLALSACGSGSSPSAPAANVTSVAGNADSSDVAVIEGWAQALKRDDIDAAASYFAIPSVAENGGPPVRIRSPEEARAFNALLPCGAYVIRAQSIGRFTTATFRLTERPGPGSCGAGTGATAQTSFVIQDGKIVQWRRVGAGVPSQGPPSQAA